MVAAALLLGTAAEAKPYKVTITGGYYDYFSGGTQGSVTLQAIINDPPVVTTVYPDEPDCLEYSGCNGWRSVTSFATYFDTKVDGAPAAKSYMDLTLNWLTFDGDEGYGISHFKYLDVSFNALSLPALAAIANPSIDAICQTAFQPAGPCTSITTSSQMIANDNRLIGVDRVLIHEDATKDILNFSLGDDVDFRTFGLFSAVRWNATPPAGYSGDAETSGENIVEFNTFSFTISPVPEPASWAIMLTGFGLIGAMTRRRTRALAHA